ncbi:DNA helicase/exodeoxyribonuclease V gamma subunit [Azomonas agilis]|uniref:RecBCD enzyme subunit RecC n=1 Tax=Azomonas agilis TaxID=116849 RepID=A0A562IKY6_9GAMM|nr:exodeoxyribonuclease V subunit gamma [Azomonas agilis]TWH71385.1 DNA helicase/exodeoxyribonuclease V gamma subunit [Azomonas agilis]
MLTLFHAADLEDLSELALEVLKKPRANPLAPEAFVVPSQGMGRWLTLQLARRQGIAMQLNMELPSSFIWSLARTVLGSLPEQSAFNPINLSWRLYAWLKDEHNLRQVPRLENYLSQCDEQRRLGLAAKIADVFDQYLLYRDDWLAAWEQGKLLSLGPDEDWQAFLWRELTRDGHPHRARVLETVLKRLFDPEPIAGIPERLILFGISSLPVHHLRVLEGLAQHTQIFCFAINPTRESWGDIRDLREQARFDHQAPLSPDEWYLDLGNPLLASLGKQGRDFFDGLFSLIADSQGQETGVYPEDDELDDSSLLKALQNDIIRLRTRPEDERIAFQAQDRSLEVHIAHSALREVEILHDQLLARFAADPELTPDQVVVLTPDIEVYAPFIDAVFAPRAEVPRIPYSLADRGLRTEIPLIEHFLQLLSLPDSRFSAEELLTWLHQPALARRVGIEEKDLPLVRFWLQQAGVRWGRDARQRAQLKLPETPDFTWQQGLDRLLLGFAAPPQLAQDAPPLLYDHWPLDAVEGSRGELLGRLADLVHQLGQLAEQLAHPRPLTAWADTLLELLELLFDEQEAGDTLMLLTRACADLREQARISQMDLPIPLELVRQRLTSALESTASTTGFLTGMVTFCTMVPMRSLPFKVICLLGLNDGAFPRRTPAAGFDLIARHPRRGDRTRRLDDRYLLLEALMSARQGLYLSYVGLSPRDNKALPPSVLISELLEVVDQTAYLDSVESSEPKVSQVIVHQHPLQPFAPCSFQQGAHSGFARPWFKAAQQLAESAQSAMPFVATELSLNDTELSLDPERFIQCLQHPARFFLQQRLGIQRPDLQQAIEPNEPFELDRGASKQVQHLALSACEYQWSVEDELHLARSAGWLPTGALGTAHWGSVRAPVQAFAPRLLQERPQEAPWAMWIDESLDQKLRLCGWLNGVTSKGLFAWKLTEASNWDKTAFWLRHLLLNLNPNESKNTSRLLTPEQDWVLPPLHPDQARALLNPWLEACLQAHQQPLPLFARSSYAFAGALQQRSSKKDPLEVARDRAYQAWQGNDYQGGEGQEFWNALAFRDREALDTAFESLAQRLLIPLLEHLADTE